MTIDFDLRLDTLRAAYSSAKLSPRALIAAVHDQATNLQAEFNLFIHLLTKDELEPYLAALDSKSPAELPLYGIPFAIKDNIDLAGIPTTAACPAFAYTPETSATIVEQLIALGAIPLGKTNLDQFATGLNGTRSPYGECRNSVHPAYPSGGSSAGSSLAVALGLASFALGTDTAGSGRVPAALNNLIGLKASKGLISTAGVVPACRTLDCVTFFTATAAEASQLLALTAELDPRDEYSRANPLWNDSSAFGQVKSFRFGVPKQPEFLGCSESPALFAATIEHLKAIGGEPVEIDFAPFLEAARLLYEGPWVAERYSVAGALIEQQPDAVLPVIKAVLEKAPGTTAVQLFQAEYRLQQLKAVCDRIMAKVDCVLTPAYPRPVTLDELHAEPVKRNSDLGYYTNFMNMLDYAAVAVPAGVMQNGLPWGVTLFGRVFTDQYLLSLADMLQRQHGIALIGGQSITSPAPQNAARSDRARVVVCGAHLDGLPLNGQLRQRGGRLLEATRSAAHYKLYALAGGPPFRPGMVRVADEGVAIEVEIWEIPSSELGSFLTGIPAPLGLGKVQLADGSWETGFICEPYGLQGAVDISEYGGWRVYMKSRS
ncbi:allophanate hydrolase [Pseudomonas sp. Choline-3u-10]|jgi:allophanate hydrolase|uniref:allophanate hydrolase n=1 Tax=Pseudomonadaceae TaxID=135621 RepID=UPI000617E928|nr:MULTISPECIES: allophanate hydrolase [Pseudomonadaceae]MAL35498.1 allophanate hydrolase [Pseudomonas sp.]MBU0950750.1 allophanate hydrolase [Gammaproteobacteria bacterium]KJJ65230.1 allophanate hydrolase [Pseudomonas sp. 10B238]MBK3795540.1 allophanate hydrolase [Stutzerimonas stutzeri]MBK3878105.1 allophanate hydrolase [Stutzerimonas stutzeri]|tara:strand:- start:50 stop:1852 length:1803 start_codon:yes stop_codon:yes gene_type:complete